MKFCFKCWSYIFSHKIFKVTVTFRSGCHLFPIRSNLVNLDRKSNNRDSLGKSRHEK
jgi:hypothetical protein